MADCELCESAGGAVLWRDAQMRIVRVAEPGYRGYCRVIWLAHVREMTDLAPAERQHLMDGVFATEAALRALLQPAKINVASLGNITPHLHWHVIARFADDPHFPGVVWTPPTRPPVSSPERPTNAELSGALHRHLGSGVA